MRNIRKFQRLIIIGFIAMNALVYAKMNHYSVQETIAIIATLVAFFILITLIWTKRKKYQTKMNQ